MKKTNAGGVIGVLVIAAIIILAGAPLAIRAYQSTHTNGTASTQTQNNGNNNSGNTATNGNTGNTGNNGNTGNTETPEVPPTVEELRDSMLSTSVRLAPLPELGQNEHIVTAINTETAEFLGMTEIYRVLNGGQRTVGHEKMNIVDSVTVSASGAYSYSNTYTAADIFGPDYAEYKLIDDVQMYQQDIYAYDNFEYALVAHFENAAYNFVKSDATFETAHTYMVTGDNVYSIFDVGESNTSTQELIPGTHIRYTNVGSKSYKNVYANIGTTDKDAVTFTVRNVGAADTYLRFDLRQADEKVCNGIQVSPYQSCDVSGGSAFATIPADESVEITLTFSGQPDTMRLFIDSSCNGDEVQKTGEIVIASDLEFWNSNGNAKLEQREDGVYLVTRGFAELNESEDEISIDAQQAQTWTSTTFDTDVKYLWDGNMYTATVNLSDLPTGEANFFHVVIDGTSNDLLNPSGASNSTQSITYNGKTYTLSVQDVFENETNYYYCVTVTEN